MKKLQLFLKILLSSAILSGLFLALPAAAQVQNNIFKVAANIIQPVVNSWALKLPYLGGSGTKCIQTDNNGLLGTTTCGGASTNSMLTATGNVDDSNTSYTFASAPSFLVINGDLTAQTGGPITWLWDNNVLTATLLHPVGTGGSIYGVAFTGITPVSLTPHAQLTVDANTTALYHMDGIIGDAAKLTNSEGTGGRDLIQVGNPQAGIGQVIVPTNGTYTNGGDSDYVYGTVNMGGGPFTVEGWIKVPSNIPGDEALISTYITGGENYFSILEHDFGSGPQAYFEIDFTDGYTQGYAPTSFIIDSGWHYIAVTYDASGTNSVKYYVDGVLQTITITGGANTATGGIDDLPFTFFTHNGAGGVTVAGVAFDEFRFSNTARSGTEISNYYNN